ncbi:MAG: phytanoyl-CoA dioxygenase family protein [Heteroscytonema crispum UTEX LB 1556]
MLPKFSYKQPLPEPIEGIEVHLADDRFLLHQDYTYHVQHGYRPDIVTCGIVLDDCKLESGPLRLWPGTHRKLIPHETVMIGNYRSYQVPENRINPQDAVDITVKSGTLLLFHDLLVHSSSANRTQQPRRILFFSYCPTSTPISFDICLVENANVTSLAAVLIEQLHLQTKYQFVEVVLYPGLTLDIRQKFDKYLSYQTKRHCRVYEGSDWNHHSFQFAIANQQTLVVIVEIVTSPDSLPGFWTKIIERHTQMLQSIARSTHIAFGKSSLFIQWQPLNYINFSV